MPLYSYKAVTKNGDFVKNKVEDISRVGLMRKLKRNGLIPIFVMQTVSRKNKSKKPKRNVKSIGEIVKNVDPKVEGNKKKTLKEKIYASFALTEKVTMKDIIIFTQNFYLLKKANFNNIHAISTVIENTENLTHLSVNPSAQHTEYQASFYVHQMTSSQMSVLVINSIKKHDLKNTVGF